MGVKPISLGWKPGGGRLFAVIIFKYSTGTCKHAPAMSSAAFAFDPRPIFVYKFLRRLMYVLLQLAVRSCWFVPEVVEEMGSSAQLLFLFSFLSAIVHSSIFSTESCAISSPLFSRMFSSLGGGCSSRLTHELAQCFIEVVSFPWWACWLESWPSLFLATAVWIDGKKFTVQVSTGSVWVFSYLSDVTFELWKMQ